MSVSVGPFRRIPALHFADQHAFTCAEIVSEQFLKRNTHETLHESHIGRPLPADGADRRLVLSGRFRTSLELTAHRLRRHLAHRPRAFGVLLRTQVSLPASPGCKSRGCIACPRALS